MLGFSSLARLRGVRDARGFPRWLFKSKQHRGIHALWNASNAALAKVGQAIVQERVRPLLLKGFPRAFDLGVYVLVSSIRPLRFWAFDLSLVRFCERPYPQARRSHARGHARSAPAPAQASARRTSTHTPHTPHTPHM